MQQIVTYLAGREFEQAHLVGDSLSLTYVELPDASDAVFDTPSGESITIPVREHRGQFVAMLEKAAEAGFYEAKVSVQAPGLPVAVNVDSSESEVTSLTAQDLDKNLQGIDINLVNSEEELLAAIQASRTGSSLWRTFIIAGLLLLLIESLLADRLRSRKQKQSKEAVSTPETISQATNV
jgi:hypothetical protein